MANEQDVTQITVREAEEIDIPAILSLLLTSFRQFPLFSYLYSPLNDNKDCAHDTVFFWRRRVLLDLLNPTASVVVAEVPKLLSPIHSPSNGNEDEVELESWRMLEWVLQNRRLSQVSKKTPGSIIVGFAIWKDRLGGNSSPGEQSSVPRASCSSRLRSECFCKRMPIFLCKQYIANERL
jgi:hypothetical protein